MLLLTSSFISFFLDLESFLSPILLSFSFNLYSFSLWQ